MKDVELFKYSLAAGVILASIIYLPPPIFNNFPAGETGLILVSLYWLLPIVFGLAGLIGIKLKKKKPRIFAVIVCAWFILALTWFFVGLWPQL